ncbi:MAG: bifunctional glutamate N-acetyltransferase/amino-acid acetyltransferase ArgJ [Oscillospiraceae bacterium]|nr:bifunctional glutamate N-acetyltransferase/amino-acid acetyltransferase ArgJ [Oscillospiraceae bacterium]
MTNASGGITAAPGFMASGVHCGIRKNKTKRDLALVVADTDCAAAAVYTTNRVQAAPLLVTRQHLANGRARAILVNSGCANACAPGGVENARKACAAAAAATGLAPGDFIVNSTGVIGAPLPVDTIVDAMPALAAALSRDGGPAVEAIMTTDTVKKEAAVRFTLGGQEVTVGGMAKGSGMIHPNMATMLAFLTTDCAISPGLLQEALADAARHSFNRISVDGDTSTNDMCAILASGTAKNELITEKNGDYEQFREALSQVCLHLAKEMARDGEGASRLLICRVKNAQDEQAAETLAKAVISSSLFKAAMFGADANWGRVLCAMGYSGVDFDPGVVDIAFASEGGRLPVCARGQGLPFDEELARKVLSRKEIVVEADLHGGNAVAEAYGCDLTYDYVKINGDYRT